MIATLIFSRDRAMQLDLLLRSLAVNGRGVFAPIYVLYHATTSEHAESYRVCGTEHPSTTLIADSPSSLRLAGRLTERADWACCLTDDSVLYLPLSSTLPHEGVAPDVLCLSLRLGRNTMFCYPHNRTHPLPAFEQRGTLLVWDWTRASGDFGYPGSLDGHVFRGATLRAALYDCLPSASPNQIEDHLVRAVDGDRRLMACYQHSHLVGLPINVVNRTHANRNSQSHHYPVASLLQRYLAGERINQDALDFSDVRGAHQEIRLAFHSPVLASS
jgi:hypothetical protein